MTGQFVPEPAQGNTQLQDMFSNSETGLFIVSLDNNVLKVLTPNGKSNNLFYLCMMLTRYYPFTKISKERRKGKRKRRPKKKIAVIFAHTHHDDVINFVYFR